MDLLAYLTSPRMLPALMMTFASVATFVTLGDRRHPALASWRWVWVFLAFNAAFNIFTNLQTPLGLGDYGIVVNVGRIIYMPTLLLGLGEIVGHAGYRRLARAGALILALQLLLGLAISRFDLTIVPPLRTTMSNVLIVAFAAPGVLARLPRVRGSVLRDPPMIALVAALLAYVTSALYLPILAELPRGGTGRVILIWVRNSLWTLCYLMWWHAFREARRQAQPT
jgi:hypothetical protein